MEALAGLIGVIAGGLLTFLGEEFRRRRTDAEARRRERVVAYREYLAEAHLAVHLIGRASVVPGSKAERTASGAVPLTSEEQRDDAFTRVDSGVARRLFELEIIGNKEVMRPARAMRILLTILRNEVRAGRADYWTGPYLKWFRLYQDARGAFEAATRADINPTRSWWERAPEPWKPDQEQRHAMEMAEREAEEERARVALPDNEAKRSSERIASRVCDAVLGFHALGTRCRRRRRPLKRPASIGSGAGPARR